MLKQSPNDSPSHDGNEPARTDCCGTAAIRADHHLTPDRRPRPPVHVDRELASVAERDASGIDAYRAQLKELLGDRPVQTLAHAEIITRLDQAAKLFNVLIIKTDLTLPYTSVFVELECGYWDADTERRLRDTLGT